LTLLGIIGDGRTFFDLRIAVLQKLAMAPFKMRHVRDAVAIIGYLISPFGPFR
jgi:hypothetical protein